MVIIIFLTDVKRKYYCPTNLQENILQEFYWTTIIKIIIHGGK